MRIRDRMGCIMIGAPILHTETKQPPRQRRQQILRTFGESWTEDADAVTKRSLTDDDFSKRILGETCCHRCRRRDPISRVARIALVEWHYLNRHGRGGDRGQKARAGDYHLNQSIGVFRCKGGYANGSENGDFRVSPICWIEGCAYLPLHQFLITICSSIFFN